MSTPIDDSGPAFPCDSIKQFPTQEGMSLRDWFAGQAMAGCLAYSWHNPQRGNWQENCDVETFAKAMYAHADAMIEARKTKTP